MQEVSSTVQTKAWKCIVLRQTATQAATQKNDGNSNLNNRLYNAPLPNNNEIEYFLPGPCKESAKKASAEITKQLQKEFEDVFTGIGCLDCR